MRAARLLLLSLLLYPLLLPAQDAKANLADFDQLWEFTRDHYCCFAQKATDWNKVRELYRPRAAQARDKRELVRVFEDTLDELYDAHAHLTVNLSTSWRLPAYDIWAEWQNGHAVVLEVRAGSDAERAGIVAGMAVLKVEDEEIAEAVRHRMPHTLTRDDPEADDWALRSVLAGHHDRLRRFTVRDRGGAVRTISIANDSKTPSEPLVSSKMVEEDLGYIRISSFEREAAIKMFDNALDALRKTQGLIIDVRDNHGGDTAVSRPIMGRFIKQRQQYAWMARREGDKLGERWAEYVDPRGPWTYDGPIVVIADHFTDSTAEGFAMGMDGMGRATVIGTTMGHLGAATATVTLKNSNVKAQVSAEPVYHVNGKPRDAFHPKIAIDLAKCNPKDDCILQAAQAFLTRF